MEFHRNNHRNLAGSEMDKNPHHVIWVGDFNRHHPAWDSLEDTRLFTKNALDATEVLIRMMAELRLDPALPAGMPTHVHNVTKKWTQLDQVYVSENVLDTLILCETRCNNRGLNTDHVPIITNLDVTMCRTPETRSFNFRNVDWEKFREHLQGRIAEFGVPTRIRNHVSLNKECKRLTVALQETIKVTVLTTEVYPK